LAGAARAEGRVERTAAVDAKVTAAYLHGLDELLRRRHRFSQRK
jgi:hypothetical protein